MDPLHDLLARLRSATGPDRALDAAIGQGLDGARGARPHPAYTASVDRCLELVHRVIPGWAWHVGYGPRGLLPYAALSDSQTRVEARAPTVPLALLTALLEARIASQDDRPRAPEPAPGASATDEEAKR